MHHNTLSDTIFFGFSGKLIYHSCELWGVLCWYTAQETTKSGTIVFPGERDMSAILKPAPKFHQSSGV
jgi:hypothetical protein